MTRKSELLGSLGPDRPKGRRQMKYGLWSSRLVVGPGTRDSAPEKKITITRPWWRNVYRLLVGKPEGKRPLGRPRRRWIDNIKMDLLEIGLIVVDWIGLAKDRYRWRALVNSVMNIRAP
jgi:hypothetical protein